MLVFVIAAAMPLAPPVSAQEKKAGNASEGKKKDTKAAETRGSGGSTKGSQQREAATEARPAKGEAKSQ